MASWKVVLSIIMVLNGLGLGSWNATLTEPKSIVFGWAGLLISLGLGIKADDILKRDKDKTDA